MAAIAPASAPSRQAPRPPLVDGSWLVGNTLDMARDPAAFFVRCYREYGPAFRIRVLGREQTVIAGPEAALFMGTKQGRECLRSKEFWQGLTEEYGAQRTLTGEDGQIHKEMRAILRRGYSRQAIEGRYEQVLAITRQALERDWAPGTNVAVVPAMQYLVVDQLGTLLTGEAPREYVEDIRLLITVILNVLVTKQRPKLLLRDPRYRKAKARVNELGQAMIDERLGQPLPPVDQRTLIDDVMAANIERPDLFPDSDLVLSLTGPYVAGLDTVANTLAATVYAILKHPEVLARVTAEADALFAGGVVDENTLTSAIPSINGAISEAMRLYPIAVAQMRTATADFVFEGMQIKADELLYVATSVPHFMSEFFPNPHEFDIDRYAKPRAEDRAPGAYSPYGRGPHLCLGKSLAEVQMALTIATLFHSRSLSLPGADYLLKTKTAPTPGPSRKFKVKVTDRASTCPGHTGGMSTAESLYDLSFTDNKGQSVSLRDFEGQPVLIVNTASKCGFTPQYDGLQKLHEEFAERGLVVLGFPCDQFAHQEPGDDGQIEEFCKLNYGVTFPLSTKINVNGSDTHPVFEFCKSKAGGVLGSAIKWNFTKFLVGPDGTTVKRYAPKTEPAALAADIESLLDTDSA